MFIGTTATRNRSYGDTTWRRRLPMTLSRRNALKLGLGAGASALLPGRGLAEALSAAPRAAGETGTVRARPLPLSAVRLTGGPPQPPQDLEAQYPFRPPPRPRAPPYPERRGAPAP